MCYMLHVEIRGQGPVWNFSTVVQETACVNVSVQIPKRLPFLIKDMLYYTIDRAH